MKQVSGQMNLFDLDMLYGRTSPEPFLPTKGKTSASSSKSFAKSKTKPPMFLDLRGGGLLPERSWETGIPSLGGCLMQDFGEYPSVVEESGLSQILEANVPLKYYLSAKACEGVLRRAERRGKELPEILETALKQQIERWRKYGSPLPPQELFSNEIVVFDGENITSKTNASNPQIGDPCHTLGRTGAGRAYCVKCYDFSEERRRTVQQYDDLSPFVNARCGTGGNNTPVVCYDARGNGDGNVVPTITGDHNQSVSDYTAVVCEKKLYAIDPLSSNSMKSKNPNSGFHEEIIAKCLDTSNGEPTKNQGGNVVVERYALNSSGDDIASTIDAHYYLGCGARGGKEREFIAIAIDRSAFNQGETEKYNIGVDEDGTAFTITAKGPGGVCYCLQGNGIDRADTAGCNGKGVKENESYTLNTVDRHAVCCEEKTIYVVRRLTPLECCRLQGMPDDWVADIPHSDAQEYRMWGNGMALPNALYIMEGLVENDEK